MLTHTQQVLLTLAQMTGMTPPPALVRTPKPRTGSQRREAQRAQGQATAPTSGVAKKPNRARTTATGQGGLRWMGPSGGAASDNSMRVMFDVNMMGQVQPMAGGVNPKQGHAAVVLPLGMHVMHTGNDGTTRQAVISKVFYDDSVPYYSIRFADGSERDTDRQHLRPLPDVGATRTTGGATGTPAATGRQIAQTEMETDDVQRARAAPAAATAVVPAAAAHAPATGAAGEQQQQQQRQQPRPATSAAKAQDLLPNLDASFRATASAIGPLRPNPRDPSHPLPPERVCTVEVNTLRVLPGDDLRDLPHGGKRARPNKTLTVYEHITAVKYSQDHGYNDPVTGTLHPSSTVDPTAHPAALQN